MKMIEGPWLFGKFSGTWLFKDHDLGRTRVIFRYNFQCRLGPANLVLHPLIARVFRRSRHARGWTVSLRGRRDRTSWN